MESDRSISLATLSQRVSTCTSCDPTILSAELAKSGHLSVYHLRVATATGPTDWVLKAPPDEDTHGIDTESRLVSLIAERTSIPVPQVVGAVDVHDSLPAPFFLMEKLEGTKLEKREIGDLSDSALQSIVRQTGRYLASLHALDGPAGYGQVDIDRTETVFGDVPSTGLSEVTTSPLPGQPTADTTDWPAVLRVWTEDALERHAETRFGDLTAEVRPVIRERADSIEGPFTPVLGRIDHGLHNLLLEPEAGTITGVIDWAFTLSVPPAYDLACVEANLTLGP